MPRTSPFRTSPTISQPALRTIAFVFAVALAVAVALTAVSLRSSWREIESLRDQSIRVDEGHAALLAAEQVLSLVKDAETGQRGFLLTGEPAYLEPYEAAIGAIPTALTRMQELAAHDPDQRAQVAAIERATAEKLAELDRTLRLRREQGEPVALEVVRSNEGKRAMDALRAQVDVLVSAERARLQAHLAQTTPKTLALWRTLEIRSGLLLGALAVALVSIVALTRSRAESTRSRGVLATTLRSIGDAVMATDRAGRIRFLNPIAEQLTGYTNSEAEGRLVEEVFRIVNQETRATVESPTVRALRDGVIVGLANHTILIAKDGTERAIDDSASPIRDDAGHVEGVVLIFRDISERYEIMRHLRESERRKAAVIEASLDCIVKTDADGLIVEFNPAAEQVFGYRRDAVLGKPMADLLVPPRLRPRYFEAMEHYLETGEGRVLGQRHEATALHADGSEIPIELAVIRVPIEGPPLFAAFLRDVTDRKHAERRVRASELRYRRVFEAAKDGVLIVDVGSRKILDANAVMTALTGLEQGDLAGLDLRQIGLFESDEAAATAFSRLGRSGYFRSDHSSLRNTLGQRIEVEFIGSTYEEEARLLAQFNVRPISERIAMQKKLAEQAASIAAESRRKDEFLAMLSHELRNPLAPIRAAVHTLRELKGADAGIQDQAHGIIERQVGNLTRLIGDLLEVSRVLSGRIHLEQQVVDLNVVLNHAIETARPSIEQRHHRLLVEACHKGVWANVDATRMEEVLVNLLNNAAKYTPEGGVIEVHCEHPRGASHVQIRVRDDGIGIDPELLRGDRIFDLFTQAERSLDRAQGGLGLGLSLARRIVDLHGGSLEAKSPPEDAEKGSEFVVKLPLVLAPIEALARTTTDAPPARAEAKSVKILVVDDNVDLATMVAHSLQLKGYAVQVAFNGATGLILVEQWKPDVVLLDIGLPGLDGYEIARRLRADTQHFEDGFPGRLIAATGYGRPSDVELCREAGFDAHLVKPYDLGDLERLIVETLA